MPSATVCAWIELTTYSDSYSGTIASYGTSTDKFSKNFVMKFNGASTIIVRIKDEEIGYDVSRPNSGSKVNIYPQNRLLTSFSGP